MKNLTKIMEIMNRISELLRVSDEDEWALRIDEYRIELPKDTTYVLSKIAALYGGMGSLNDIVLYRNGQPMIAENNELHKLRSELHERCVGA
ncbi:MULTISPECIES: DUF6966 domain-containing protein [unclassified Pseudomonas]|uniref:DUF6966 domain-containing protein n=1 Tax=unclassified Pseudomonas TaxID=196821 RepID=UPI00159F8E1C|nr:MULTISPECIES: hypothetical protein [unclassified Pseudomonas]NWC93016.1 hypothetical protein [Pseudomonas sp. IPO3779]NWD19434.1 hypothetical protein [Pseudomonas sp. IPO3778]